MKDYRIVRCTGEQHVAGAIEKMQEADPDWEVHTVLVTNVEEHEIGNPLDISATKGVVAISKFMILFHREYDERKEPDGPNLVVS